MINRSFLICIHVIILSILVTVNASPANAQVISAEVSVVGMACPFCAYGVEKKLRNVEGVRAITIDMKGGAASLSAIEGQSININGIPAAVKESGFSPGKIEITAIGNVKKSGQQKLFLIIPDTDLSISFSKIKGDLKDRLASYEQTGALVEVHGVIYEESGGAWTLSPETIAEVHK